MTITESFQEAGTSIILINCQCRWAELREANSEEFLRFHYDLNHLLSTQALVYGHTKLEAGGEENGGLRVWRTQMRELLLKLEDLLWEAFGVVLANGSTLK
ncbi:MAG: hypothetical protein LQ346_008976 [Caloplaca aetnensis]|nr:MAG: hypothetical protein LQ346_008976 [Caloplaca aetnensis]